MAGKDVLAKAKRQADKKSGKITEKDCEELQSCIELLYAVELIEYHNKNWLPSWAIKSPKKLSQEKQALLKRALVVIGSSAANPMT